MLVYKHVQHAPPTMMRRPVHTQYRVTSSTDMQYAMSLWKCGRHETAGKRDTEDNRRPPAWMPYWRGIVLGVPTAVLVGAVDQTGRLALQRPPWLGLNYWLH